MCGATLVVHDLESQRNPFGGFVHVHAHRRVNARRLSPVRVVLESDVDVHDAVVVHEWGDRAQWMRDRRGLVFLVQCRQPGTMRATELVQERGPLPARNFAGTYRAHHCLPATGKDASCNSARTSSSVVCRKSSYHCPTAAKCSGHRAQTISSAIAANSRHVSGEPTGTATITVAGACARTARTAALIVDPVASPSSISTTT